MRRLAMIWAAAWAIGCEQAAPAAATPTLPEFTVADLPDPYDCVHIEYHFPDMGSSFVGDRQVMPLAVRAQCICFQMVNGKCTDRDHMWFHGSYESWYSGGQRHETGTFRYQRRHGRWLTWSEDGTFAKGACFSADAPLWEVTDEADATGRPCGTEPASR